MKLHVFEIEDDNQLVEEAVDLDTEAFLAYIDGWLVSSNGKCSRPPRVVCFSEDTRQLTDKVRGFVNEMLKRKHLENKEADC